MEEADPTVKAINEIAQPMARGYELFTGGGEDKKQTGFLRKILNALMPKKSASMKLSQPAAITEAGKKGGILGSLGGLLPGIPGLGGIGSSIGGLASSGLKLASKGAKRIPVIGSLLAGAMAWMESSNAEADPSLTADQRNAKKGSAWGSAGGAVVGAAVGSLLGPVGTIVGGVVGDWLGGKFGETIGENWSSMTDSISKTWDGCTKQFGSFVDSAKSGWETVSGMFVSALETVKNIPIIKKAGDLLGAAKDKAVEVGGKAVDAAKSSAEYLGNNTLTGRAVKTAGNWILGQTSKMFESGKGGAGTVSSGKGDLGGASYGTYQLSSKAGTLDNFLKSSKYGAQFDGLKPGTPEFDAKWKEVAKNDPEFGSAQHDFIKQTHFDPQMAKLAKSGIDLSEKGQSVQDAVWSTSVQFGGKSDLIKKALAGKDASKMSDSEVVSAIQDYKINNNDALFKSSSASVRAGTAKRAINEKSQLLSLADKGAAESTTATMPAMSSRSATVASGSLPSAPSIPSVPAINEAPGIVEPMASNSNRGQSVSVVSADVGQDISERRIAHIVTGGLSAA